ncbi:MAG: hypothetical protein L0Z54_03040 [Thermoplasmata archaeon]|nr:hypothetical protein [Thermoplasmata archaeon]
MTDFDIEERHREILMAMAAQPDGCVFLPRLESLMAKTVEGFASELYDLEREGLIRRENGSDVICLSYSAHSQFQITERGIDAMKGGGPRKGMRR